MNTATTKRAGGELAGFPAGVTLVLDRAELIGWATDASRRRGAVPLAIARPVSADEVQQVIQWANLTGVPLVPASSAEGPRRRGDTVCSRPALILDLSRLDRIIHVDGRDAITVIEPGVSFAAFDKALRPHGLRSFRPLLARPAKSVIAAFLEREPITVPGQHWDSADPLGATEFVFGTGKPYRTGGGPSQGRSKRIWRPAIARCWVSARRIPTLPASSRVHKGRSASSPGRRSTASDLSPGSCHCLPRPTGSPPL